MIFALAQAIREGRRREVADLNPEVVQNALSSSLGGPTRAKQLLNNPISHRLITRHQIALESLQRDIRFLGQSGPQRARGGSAGLRPPYMRAGHVARPNPPNAGSGMEANLQEMITVNEAPHLNEVAMHERERLQGVLQASGEGPSRSEFSPRGQSGAFTPTGMSYSPMGASGTRSPIASSIDAPKSQARIQPEKTAESKNTEAQGPQQIKGTFQLRGHNNQMLGVVELEDGEITN
jgi:hypothetical protein